MLAVRAIFSVKEKWDIYKVIYGLQVRQHYKVLMSAQYYTYITIDVSRT